MFYRPARMAVMVWCAAALVCAQAAPKTQQQTQAQPAGQSEAQAKTPAAAAPADDKSPIAAAMYGPLMGMWSGVLEYRDFQSDQIVQLPTWLDVVPTKDPSKIQFQYTYDDGPNKVVREVSLITIDVTANTFTVTSEGDKSVDTYQVAGLKDFLTKGRGLLTLTGTGTENEKKVDVRITISVRRNLYSYKKETKLPGQDFLFRDAYTLTRRDPPYSPTPMTAE